MRAFYDYVDSSLMAKKTASERAAERLTTLRLRFAAIYCSNGRNATQAYIAIHPGVLSTSAGTNGGEWLRNTEVVAEIRRLTNEAWKSETLSAEETLARMSRIATQNIRDYYWKPGELDRHGQPTQEGFRKPLSELSEAQTECIKGFKFSPEGLVIQEHYDKAAQLANMAKHHKLLSDNLNVNLTMPLDKLIEASYGENKDKA